VTDPTLENLPGLDDAPHAPRVTDSGPRIRLLSCTELMCLPDPVWQLTGYLIAGSFALLFASRESFKSFLALSWAFHIAAGRPWFGRPVRQGPVVVVAAEGASGLRKRAEALLKAMDLHHAELPFYVIPHALNLTRADHAEALLAALAPLKPVLVILDTQSRMLGGKSTVDEEAFMQLLGTTIEPIQQRFGATVLGITHTTKKDDAGATGTGQQENTADTIVKIVRQEGSDFATLKTTKQKDFEHAPDLDFRMVKHAGSLVLLIPEEGEIRPLEDFSQSIRQALDCLENVQVHDGWVSPTIWREATGLPKSTFHLAQAKAEKAKLVESQHLSKHRKVYRITPGGREMVRSARSNSSPTPVQLDKPTESNATPVYKTGGVGLGTELEAA